MARTLHPEAQSLGHLCAFVKSTVIDSEPVFYSSLIHRKIFSTPSRFRESRVLFEVELKRRRLRAIENSDQESSPVFQIAEADFLTVIKALIACSTWTHGEFFFCTPTSTSQWNYSDVSTRYRDLVLGAASLLRSSRSLCSVTITPNSFCPQYLPTLLCENPYLETLTLGPASSDLDLSLYAKTIGTCLSQNSVLRSCTIFLVSFNFGLDVASLEALLRPFAAGDLAQSEANVTLKELVLHFADPNAHLESALVDLVRCNVTLERLEFCFKHCDSRLRKGGCAEIGRALEVNRSLKVFGCHCDSVGLKKLIAPFVPDRSSGRQSNTTVSSLNLFLMYVPKEVYMYRHTYISDGRGEEFLDHVKLVLDDLASMLEVNTTLKHVQLSYEWGQHKWEPGDVKTWLGRKHVEFGIQKKLKKMICNELRSNTCLESLAVGFWKLRRVGTKWQTSYGGFCLKERPAPPKEYNVKVKLLYEQV